MKPQARRLNCRIPQAVTEYNKRLEGNIRKHRLIERVGAIHRSDSSAGEKKRQLDRLDEESKQYMINAEKKCRRIKSGRIPFSPDVAKWIRRSQVYRSLLRNVHRGNCNRGNLRRAALRVGIEAPFTLTEAEITARLEVCIKHCDYYQQHGAENRKRHLQERLEKAREAENEEAENGHDGA